MKALIVEDDYVSRVILQRMLLAFGDVQIAVDGEEGIRVFTDARKSRVPFDLVCVDIMLPKMDGLSVLHQIRAAEAADPTASDNKTRVIMTTALSDKDHVVEAIKECDAYLVKPYQKDKLITHLRAFGLAP